ncbi:MAG: NAD-dependent epimerase/dehydratase family protein [Acidimicrobiales bacterium]
MSSSPLPAPSLPDAPERTLIVGAGDLGLALATRLVDAGASVTTLNRSGKGVSGADSWVGDLAEPPSLEGLPPADLVVFTTAPPGRDEAAYRLAYLDGPRRILEALPAAPGRAVLTSTTGVHGTDDGSWVDEQSPTEPTRDTAAVVLAGERALRAAVPTVVLRPAGIYGPGRNGLQDRVRAGDAPIARDGTVRWTNRVHRDDVVAALLVAATHAAPPDTLIAVDDEPAPRDDVIRFLVERLGAPEPSTVDVAAVTGKRCRNSALRSLGWQPEYPTYREGYASLLG